MKALMVLVLCLPLLSTTSAFAAKHREWKIGTLVSIDSNDMIKYQTEIYKIDDGTVVWVGTRATWLRWDKPLMLTVNAPIKFAIEGRSIVIIDELGKEHKLALQHKIAK